MESAQESESTDLWLPSAKLTSQVVPGMSTRDKSLGGKQKGLRLGRMARAAPHPMGLQRFQPLVLRTGYIGYGASGPGQDAARLYKGCCLIIAKKLCECKTITTNNLSLSVSASGAWD